MSVILCGILCIPISASAEPSTSMMISELQTGSNISANDEFIELYNSGSDSADLSVYKLEYFASSATSFIAPFRTISLTGIAPPNSNYLVASTDYLADVADLNFAKFIAASGGNIRLVKVVDQTTTQVDLVAWGTGLMPEGVKATAPGDGKSLSRKTTLTGLQDTDNNSQDFEILTIPSPHSGVLEISQPEPDPVLPDPTLPTEPPADTPPAVENPPETNPAPENPEPVIIKNLLPIQITELLPNPASPATDDSDEFVEVYNPNEDAVDLSSYVIKTGANLSYQQSLSGIIAPKSYAVFYSRDTDLVLSNTTGKAVLYDQTGAAIFSTDPYSDAPEGQSWVLSGGIWQWTTAPTPMSENNVLVVSENNTKSTSGTAKPKAAKKATAAKVAGTKTASAKKASSPKATKAKAATTNNPAEIVEKPPLHPVILGTVGFLALLYGLYEYRADIRNQIIKLSRNRSSR